MGVVFEVTVRCACGRVVKFNSNKHKACPKCGADLSIEIYKGGFRPVAMIPNMKYTKRPKVLKVGKEWDE